MAKKNTIEPGRKLSKLQRLKDLENLSTISENLHNGTHSRKNSRSLIKLSIKKLR